MVGLKYSVLDLTKLRLGAANFHLTLPNVGTRQISGGSCGFTTRHVRVRDPDSPMEAFRSSTETWIARPRVCIEVWPRLEPGHALAILRACISEA